MDAGHDQCQIISLLGIGELLHAGDHVDEQCGNRELAVGPEGFDQALLSKLLSLLVHRLRHAISKDHQGVATLVGIYKSSQAKDGTLKLLNLSKKFQETLQLTRLLTVFETFNNETQALASFK